MRNVFRAIAQYIRNSPLAVPLWALFAFLLITSAGATLEALGATYQAYHALPTRKACAWLEHAIAVLPALGQVAFAYIWMEDTRRKWALGLWVLMHGVATGALVWYKAAGQSDVWVWVAALVEVELFFTLGAYLIFVVSLGMTVALWPACAGQVAALGILEAIRNHLWHVGIGYGARPRKRQGARRRA